MEFIGQLVRRIRRKVNEAKSRRRRTRAPGCCVKRTVEAAREVTPAMHCNTQKCALATGAMLTNKLLPPTSTPTFPLPNWPRQTSRVLRRQSRRKTNQETRVTFIPAPEGLHIDAFAIACNQNPRPSFGQLNFLASFLEQQEACIVESGR